MEEARRIDDEGSKQAAALKKKTEDVWRVSEGLDNFTGAQMPGPLATTPCILALAENRRLSYSDWFP